MIAEGERHIVFRQTFDADDGFHTTIRENAHWTATNASGVKYVAVEVFDSQDTSQQSSATNFASAQPVIAKGPTDNFLLHIEFHFTVNANGEFTSEVTQLTAECLG